MPPRLPSLPAIRQLSGLFAKPVAGLSTTSRTAALKKELGSDEQFNPFSNSSNSSYPNNTNREQPRQPPPSSPSKALLGLGEEPDPTDTLHSLYKDSYRRSDASRKHAQANTMQRIQQAAVAQAYLQQMPRPWREGDVYAPRDLGPGEMLRWRRSSRHKADLVDLLGINPLEHYKNFSMISEHMTSMGRIQHSKYSGLRPVNQRRMSKAIRRAIGMGIHPSVHRHPELLRLAQRSSQARGGSGRAR